MFYRHQDCSVWPGQDRQCLLADDSCRYSFQYWNRGTRMQTESCISSSKQRGSNCSTTKSQHPTLLLVEAQHTAHQVRPGVLTPYTPACWQTSPSQLWSSPLGFRRLFPTDLYATPSPPRPTTVEKSCNQAVSCPWPFHSKAGLVFLGNSISNDYQFTFDFEFQYPLFIQFSF